MKLGNPAFEFFDHRNWISLLLISPKKHPIQKHIFREILDENFITSLFFLIWFKFKCMVMIGQLYSASAVTSDDLLIFSATVLYPSKLFDLPRLDREPLNEKV